MRRLALLLLLSITTLLQLYSQCPALTCAGDELVSIDIDTLSDCTGATVLSLSGADQAGLCQDENGLSCFAIRVTRGPLSDVTSVVADLGVGPACEGVVQAVYFSFKDPNNYVQVCTDITDSSASSINLASLFPEYQSAIDNWLVKEVKVFICVDPNANASMCNICTVNAESCIDPGCDDGVCTNGVETFDPVSCMCVPGTPPVDNCDDGICSNGIEVLDPMTCTCVVGTPAVKCDDGICTNGIETQDPVTCECIPGTPPVDNCDDGDCTNGLEFLDPIICECMPGTPTNPDQVCPDDGICANGTEFFDSVTCSCESDGISTCPPTGGGGVDSGDIPTMGEWGLMILTLLLMIVSVVRIREVYLTGVESQTTRGL